MLKKIKEQSASKHRSINEPGQGRTERPQVCGTAKPKGWLDFRTWLGKNRGQEIRSIVKRKI